MRGLYIHIPFCKSKCGYCDFYSFRPSVGDMDKYLEAVLSCMKIWSKRITGEFDTIYFGGGTPSFFGGERISKIIESAKELFCISPFSEITVECNPSSSSEELMNELSKAGVNRVSLGVQSALTSERKLLGRLSNSAQAKEAVSFAKKCGINNVSLDLMLGIPGQTIATLDESIDFILSCGASHVSAYMLKLEEGTALYKNRKSISFPDEDEVCDMYLHAVERLENEGFEQYEISNFAKPGFESRHNLKYWKCEEYLGIGPAAHSFIGGKRFFYSRSFDNFVAGVEPILDGDGASAEEYIMLRLRLKEGVDESSYKARYGRCIPESMWNKAKEFEKSGHMELSEGRMNLTPKGFLVSNYIIGELIDLLCGNARSVV